MLKEALNYIKSILIEERVIKYPDRPEADRFFNYPFEAIEEAIVNAVYHRSYDVREPVEVRILPDCVTICSHAGLDRSIHLKDLESTSFLSRRYRNRRIGEFLKELDMTEGRGTGIPKIRKALERNQSPPPIFHSDEDRTYFAVEFPLHPAFVKSDADMGNTKKAESKAESKILLAIATNALSMQDIADSLKKKTITGALKRDVKNLLQKKLIERTIPDKPNSRLQKYRLTAKGKAVVANGVNV